MKIKSSAYHSTNNHPTINRPNERTTSQTTTNPLANIEKHRKNHSQLPMCRQQKVGHFRFFGLNHEQLQCHSVSCIPYTGNTDRPKTKSKRGLKRVKFCHLFYTSSFEFHAFQKEIGKWLKKWTRNKTVVFANNVLCRTSP